MVFVANVHSLVCVLYAVFLSWKTDFQRKFDVNSGIEPTKKEKKKIEHDSNQSNWFCWQNSISNMMYKWFWTLFGLFWHRQANRLLIEKYSFLPFDKTKHATNEWQIRNDHNFGDACHTCCDAMRCDRNKNNMEFFNHIMRNVMHIKYYWIILLFMLLLPSNDTCMITNE